MRILMVTAALLVAACGGDAERASEPLAYADIGGRRFLTIENGFVRPIEAGGMSTAGYATIVSETDNALVAASSPFFDTVELHEVTEVNGVSRMRRVAEIALPPGDRVHLAPGSYHLMMMGPSGSLAEGDMVEVTYTFANALTMTVAMPVSRTPVDGSGTDSSNMDHSGH